MSGRSDSRGVPPASKVFFAGNDSTMPLWGSVTSRNSPRSPAIGVPTMRAFALAFSAAAIASPSPAVQRSTRTTIGAR